MPRTRLAPLLSAALVMTFLLASCGPAAPQTGGSGGQQVVQTGDWRTQWDNTLAGARREGTIRIISGSSSTNNMPAFEKAFADLTGGRVEFTVEAACPSNRISPAAMSSKPARQRSKVVFPQPLGPRKQPIWPSGSRKLKASSTSVRP